MEDSERIVVRTQEAMGSERGSLSSSSSDNCKLEEGTEEMYILIFIRCYILSIGYECRPEERTTG